MSPIQNPVAVILLVRLNLIIQETENDFVKATMMNFLMITEEVLDGKIVAHMNQMIRLRLSCMSFIP